MNGILLFWGNWVHEDLAYGNLVSGKPQSLCSEVYNLRQTPKEEDHGEDFSFHPSKGLILSYPITRFDSHRYFIASELGNIYSPTIASVH